MRKRNKLGEGIPWNMLLKKVPERASAGVIVKAALAALIDEALTAIPEGISPRARRKRISDGINWTVQLLELLRCSALNDYAIKVVAMNEGKLSKHTLFYMTRIALAGESCTPSRAEEMMPELCRSGLLDEASCIAKAVLGRSLSADEVRALVDAYGRHDGDISQGAAQKLIELVEETLEASEATKAKTLIGAATASAPLR